LERTLRPGWATVASIQRIPRPTRPRRTGRVSIRNVRLVRLCSRRNSGRGASVGSNQNTTRPAPSGFHAGNFAGSARCSFAANLFSTEPAPFGNWCGLGQPPPRSTLSFAPARPSYLGNFRGAGSGQIEINPRIAHAAFLAESLPGGPTAFSSSHGNSARPASLVGKLAAAGHSDPRNTDTFAPPLRSLGNLRGLATSRIEAATLSANPRLVAQKFLESSAGSFRSRRAQELHRFISEFVPNAYYHII
jgi:hypothetical protein